MDGLIPIDKRTKKFAIRIDLLLETGYLPSGESTETLLSECNEIISILAASVKTAKQNGEG